jgi:3-oxoacyl-(acyl-carrier-protein) synthase
MPHVPPLRIGVVVGATVGGMMHTEDWIEERALGAERRVAARPAIRHLPLWEAPHVLAATIGAAGPAFAVATACASGTQAIACAADLIVTGVCDVVLTGGADALARVTYHGFASLGLLDRERCRPFDPGRAGLNLGEGAAFLLLAADGAAGPPLAWLDGWASTADAHHATAPRPDGSGLAAAIRGALGRAGAAPRDVDWVHAHGTATQNNDGVEAEAVATVFGAGAVPVSSTKHVFGHTLGAAGAVSAVVAVEAIRTGFIPGNGPVAPPGTPGADVVPPAGLRRQVRRVVVNSMGFGGTNAALVISEATR